MNESVRPPTGTRWRCTECGHIWIQREGQILALVVENFPICQQCKRLEIAESLSAVNRDLREAKKDERALAIVRDHVQKARDERGG